LSDGGGPAPPLSRAVVVITGASSGIGRAAALRIARHGGTLVLCARDADALSEVAEACRRTGATVMAESVDVTDEDAVRGLADGAVERFGRLDVWVNNAAVMAYGEFEDIPSDVFRKIIETNLMGQVHGARAALPHFTRQRAGVLVLMSSVWGRVPSPLVSPYVVSKNAVRAFGECLRQELSDDDDIHVATIVPQAVDTPIFEHAANYSKHRLRPIPHVLDPDQVARGIERCAESPKAEVSFGRMGRGLEVLYAVAPRLYCRMMPAAFVRGTMTGEESDNPGNVLASAQPYEIHGGWRSNRKAELARAFFDAAAGGVTGLFGASASLARRRR
jgi:NAD(P)-dependent dehydrogenase (short-subunit alcohol dehydrogenase family)